MDEKKYTFDIENKQLDEVCTFLLKMNAAFKQNNQDTYIAKYAKNVNDIKDLLADMDKTITSEKNAKEKLIKQNENAISELGNIMSKNDKLAKENEALKKELAAYKKEPVPQTQAEKKAALNKQVKDLNDLDEAIKRFKELYSIIGGF